MEFNLIFKKEIKEGKSGKRAKILSIFRKIIKHASDYYDFGIKYDK